MTTSNSNVIRTNSFHQEEKTSQEDMNIESSEIERIKLLRQIGKGGFSTVHLSQHNALFQDHAANSNSNTSTSTSTNMSKHSPTQPHLKLALKLIPKSQIQELELSKKVKQEINSLKACNHPHIMKLYKVMETPYHVILVSDYLNAGELHDYILERMNQNNNNNKGKYQRPLPHDEARRYVQEIASAISYLHDKKNICHRDLKLENLLLYRRDDNKTKHQFVKIADFGFSHVLNGEQLTTACGSPFFAAPEIISNQAYFGDCVDVWAFGVILYVILCGRLPFQKKDMKTMYAKIRKGEYELPNYLKEEERELILGMMKVNSVERMNMIQVCNSKYYLRSLPHYLHAHRLESKTKDSDHEVVVGKKNDKKEKENEYIISNHMEACSRVNQILQASNDPIYSNISIDTVDSLAKSEEDDYVDSHVTAARPFKTKKMKIDDDWEEKDNNEVALTSEVSQDIILIYKMCLEELLIAQRIKELKRATQKKKNLMIGGIILAIILIILLACLVYWYA